MRSRWISVTSKNRGYIVFYIDDKVRLILSFIDNECPDILISFRSNDDRVGAIIMVPASFTNVLIKLQNAELEWGINKILDQQLFDGGFVLNKKRQLIFKNYVRGAHWYWISPRASSFGLTLKYFGNYQISSLGRFDK